MNKKIILSIAACCISVSMCQGYVSPIEVKAETGGVPGQVDNIYDNAYGVGIGDATMVLKHYAMNAAGLEGPIDNIVMRVGADVNGDDIINVSDATTILKFYAEYASGKDVIPSDYFKVYDVYSAAFDAYKDITEDFMNTCKNSGLEPRYDLAYIDGNMIPELILSPSTTHVDGGCTIYTYLNGKAILLGENCFGSMGEVKCGWGDGIIVNDMAYTGLRGISVKKLEHGELKEIMYADINYLTGKATLNGAASTESEVEAAIESVAPSTFTYGRSYIEFK